MPLTDPELDLLREMLEEDPADDALLQVSEDLVRRCRWADAEEVLARGVAALQGDPEREGPLPRLWELLARAALETAHYDLATSALAHVSTDPAEHPENARIRILVLERSGRTAEAAEAARRFLEVAPDDVIVEAAVERLEAPPPSPRIRAADPFYTVERAERYALIGRRERAIRAYRRILLASRPGFSGGARLPSLEASTIAGLELRLRQLQAGEGGEAASDDLSEELTDPGLVPEEPPFPVSAESAPPPPAGRPLEMPEPSLSRVAASQEGSVWVAARTASDEATLEESTTTAGADPDDEDTDVDVGRSLAEADPRRDRRKRRSLIRR